MRLIGINGFKGSGKDTTFELIKEIEFHAKVVERVGFADKLKIMAAKALGFTDKTDAECIELMNECKEAWEFGIFNSPDDAESANPFWGFDGRQYLQWFGGEARSVFGDTFWIDQVLPKPNTHPDHEIVEIENNKHLCKRYPDTDTLCVTDVRYPNEAQRILALGGEIWEIVKPGIESDGHGSEIPLDPSLVKVKLLNNGSVEDLRSLVAASL